MLGNPEQIDDTDKARAASEFGGDVGETDLEDLRDDDLARRQSIPPSHFHVRSLPQAHRGRELAAPDAVAQRAKELHDRGMPKNDNYKNIVVKSPIAPESRLLNAGINVVLTLTRRHWAVTSGNGATCVP